MAVPKKHRSNVTGTHPCGICKVQVFKYICPRCNLRYCSLQCFQDKSHNQCTESFYKDSVMAELGSAPKASSQDRHNMLQILDRFERQAVEQEQGEQPASSGITDVLTEKGVRPSHRDESSSEPSTGPAQSRRQMRLSPQERAEILQQTNQMDSNFSPGTKAYPDIDGQVDLDQEIDPEELQRLIDQEHHDLVARFSEIDLETETFESIWEKLTLEERQDFQDRFMVMDSEASKRLTNMIFDEAASSESRSRNEDDTEDEQEKEEQEDAKKLLKEMEETMQRGGSNPQSNNKEKASNDSYTNPLVADLDSDDLNAIRDAEVAELISIWRPWWEIEAEKEGQLKRLSEGSDQCITIKSTGADGSTDEPGQNNPQSQDRDHVNTRWQQQQREAAATILEPRGGQPATLESQEDHAQYRLYLDEEKVLQPQKSLIQVLDAKGASLELDLDPAPGTAPIQSASTPFKLTKRPHPTLIYHVSAFLFAFAATSRVFNGDLMEDSDHALAHLIELCPFLIPQPSNTNPETKGATQPAPVVEDFETTLAEVQRSSLDSKLWKGDTVRLEMLGLLLRDLALLLIRPSRATRCVRDVEDMIDGSLRTRNQQYPQRFKKSVLGRLSKKLEFYKSYLYLTQEEGSNSEEAKRWDRVRAEVVLTILRTRRDLEDWTKDHGKVTRVNNSHSGSKTELKEDGNACEKGTPLIQELS
ncbi:hypothetical protein BGW38_000005 [Lunasporangiospora selenospora]|uniref:HIT-type domain-containing protein n=1 Tax=Lunasporangiospora selenospora TaxID=979761 RepID=A0A9P6G4F5_9FUNG|nr:hypothetical protein BGW38_000005 [Lunasporangiospora selenospora]